MGAQGDSELDGLVRRAEARVGDVVHKWTLDALIGIGGMAAVYAATHRAGHRVAIKMLHPELAPNASVRERFLREPYVANQIKHRGAVAVLDDDVDASGSPFFVMELLEGEPLGLMLRRLGGRMPVAEALWVGEQLLDLLAVAHDQNIVHRDIKPQNVFVTDQRVVKLLDFGVARVVDAVASSATRTGSLLGTPAYMAPEQACGLWKDVDGRTDLWAVGATVFRCLAGRMVHEAETPNLILIRAATQAAPSLGTLRPDLPPDVIEAVDVALRFDKVTRWPDARSMQAAFQASLARLTSSVPHAAEAHWPAGAATTPSPPVPSAPVPSAPVPSAPVPVAQAMPSYGSVSAPGVSPSGSFERLPASGATSPGGPAFAPAVTQVGWPGAPPSAIGAATTVDDLSIHASAHAAAPVAVVSAPLLRAETFTEAGVEVARPGGRRGRTAGVMVVALVAAGAAAATALWLREPSPAPVAATVPEAAEVPADASPAPAVAATSQSPSATLVAVPVAASAQAGAAMDLRARARKLLAERKYAEAEALLRQALELDRRGAEPGKPERDLDVSRSLQLLAELLAKQGRFDDAEALLKEAVALGEKHLDENDPALDAALAELAEVLRKQGKFDEASEYSKRRKKRPTPVVKPPSSYW